jgi:glycosyltransferase involved in cell wall biosynthesis
MIKVSIITAVFNRESTIERCVLSVLQQKYENIEYIVVDGKSTDGTMTILNGYSGRVTKIVSEKDLGIYDALNKGLSMATGDVIGFLHSDDYYANDTVVGEIASALESNDCDLVYADLDFFHQNTPDKSTRFYSSSFFKPWMMRFALQPAHPTVYARKALYDRVGNFNLNYKISADFDWLLRSFVLANCKAQYLKSTFVKMQMGGASTGGIKAIINHNAEDLKILKSHGIYSNWIFVALKYTYKIFQLRF